MAPVTNIRYGYSLTLCNILVAIVLALKTRLFWPKVTFLFLNVPRGRGSTGLGNIPKNYQFFLVLPLSGIVRSLTNMLGRRDSPMKLENAYDCQQIIGYFA